MKDDGELDRCGECWKTVDGLADALGHYLTEHPRTELLQETLSEVRVRSECAECGDDMTADVSLGNDAQDDEAVLTVPSNCDDCTAADPLAGLMVRVLSPDDVLSREVTGDV